MAAFRTAHAAHGARGVWLEMDAQLTGDSVLIVLHDDDLNEQVNGNPDWQDELGENCARAVIEMTRAEIRSCDPDVPDLAEVLSEAAVEGWRLMIEIKNIPNEANFDPPGTRVALALVSLLSSTGFTDPDRVIVQSFWPPSLEVAEVAAKAAGFEVRSMLLTTAALSPAPSPVGFPAATNAAFSTLANIDIVAPDVRSIDLSAATVSAIQALGKQVIVWTANDAATIATAAEWGVDGVITDLPGDAYDILDQ